jgi:hypothetical protein
MLIKHISKSEFDRIEGSRRIIVHDYPHQFAVLDLGKPWGIMDYAGEAPPLFNQKFSSQRIS